MRKHAVVVLLVAAVATTGPACTVHHRIDPRRPLPHDRTDHARGAVEGFLVGVAAGAPIGALALYRPCPPDDWCIISGSDSAALGGLLVGGAGGIVGAVIGGLIGGQDVYERAPRVTPSIVGGHTGAAASWQF